MGIARGGHRIAVALVLCLALTACGGTSALDDAVRSLARSQGVSEDAVSAALRQQASTSDDQLKLARQWQDTLPQRPVPDADSIWDDLGRYSRDQLKGATCDAIVDVLKGGPVPTGAQFVETYLGDLIDGARPDAEVQELIEEFDALWAEARAGTLTTTDIRLTLMKLQYC